MDAAAARQELPKTADQFVDQAVKGPWPAFRANGVIDAAAEMFLRGLYDDASDDELGDLSVEDFAALAHDFWIWRAERECEDQCIRIRRGIGVGGKQLDRDVLEVAGPDMPFLVDSVMGELADQGITSLAMFHPLAPSAKGKGRDSLIQIHVPRLSAQKSKELLDGVRASLADVRASVADFQTMRQRMLDCADELENAKSNAAPSDVAEAVALLRWLAADKFTFLGSRDYQYVRDAKGALTPHEPDIISDTCLGV
ncbi:MAG: NAD-glutamate dehydrogenase, partial [Hyphomonadaceae bacterium]|nr:NAD-glutamate dehydrogenase [Hyphomonadaceae bacterium]